MSRFKFLCNLRSWEAFPLRNEWTILIRTTWAWLLDNSFPFSNKILQILVATVGNQNVRLGIIIAKTGEIQASHDDLRDFETAQFHHFTCSLLQKANYHFIGVEF